MPLCDLFSWRQYTIFMTSYQRALFLIHQKSHVLYISSALLLLINIKVNIPLQAIHFLLHSALFYLLVYPATHDVIDITLWQVFITYPILSPLISTILRDTFLPLTFVANNLFKNICVNIIHFDLFESIR